MKKYTVVLLRKAHIASDMPEGTDNYIAFVEAVTVQGAVDAAIAEVYKADKRDGAIRERTDYALNVVFLGHQEPVLFGWTL